MPTHLSRAQLTEAGLRRACLPPRAVLDRRKAFSWRGAFENWSRAYVEKNFWRVRYTFQTKDDALQECALIFARCLNYYADRVDNPAWLMSLYKIAVVNDWNTWATKESQLRSAINFDISSDTETESGETVIPPPVVMPDAMLACKLSEASTHLKAALTLLASAPAEVMTTIFSVEFNDTIINRRLKNLCGVHEKVNLLGELRALLA